MKSLSLQVLVLFLSPLVCTSGASADDYRAGDRIEIVTRADLRTADGVVGWVASGEVYTVEKVHKSWLLVQKTGTRGYVNDTHVRKALRPVAAITPQFPGSDDSFRFPEDPSLTLGATGTWEVGEPKIVRASEFRDHFGVGRGPGGAKIVGGSKTGPHGRGGSTSCQVTLSEEASLLKLRISIWHGDPGEYGKGMHSRRNGGTLNVYVNDKLAGKVTCAHRGLYGDYWPEPDPELGRIVPQINLRQLGIRKQQLTIRLETSAWTVMDLRSVNLTVDLASPVGDIVVTPADFGRIYGDHHFEEDLSFLIVNGSKEHAGPGGAVTCTVNVPEDTQSVGTYIEHGTPTQYGHGIHSTEDGGTLKVKINGKVVHTFICKKKIKAEPPLAGFWPDAEGRLSHRITVDLKAKGITGGPLKIDFEASKGTVMNVRRLLVRADGGFSQPRQPTLMDPGEGDEFPRPRPPVRDGLPGFESIEVEDAPMPVPLSTEKSIFEIPGPGEPERPREIRLDPDDFRDEGAVYRDRHQMIVGAYGKPSQLPQVFGGATAEFEVPHETNSVKFSIWHQGEMGESIAGIDSTRPDRSVLVVLNGSVVHSVKCTKRISARYYVPEEGGNILETPVIDLVGELLEQRKLKLRIATSGWTRIKVHHVQVALNPNRED